jgi:hypothetical protein
MEICIPQHGVLVDTHVYLSFILKRLERSQLDSRLRFLEQEICVL